MRIVIPGFSRAYSSLGATLAACSFWLLFNLTLVSETLWTEWLSREARILLWGLAAGAWLVAISLARRKEDSLTAAGEESLREENDPFPNFLEHYLRGDWELLAAKLARHLEHNPQDAEARLLLASVHRRQGRIRDARRQLEHLRQIDSSGRWILELHREKSLLRQLELEPTETSSEGLAPLKEDSRTAEHAKAA
ncbi:MAG: hypothetical protein NZ899_10400 [Thermoguttaceae bacterium]|nr:hypothetical protein [Thermoguttaceae bacterium]MDW8078184.1 hypothetical protein [Thermoguttaceae bacterium]